MGSGNAQGALISSGDNIPDGDDKLRAIGPKEGEFFAGYLLTCPRGPLVYPKRGKSYIGAGTKYFPWKISVTGSDGLNRRN